MKLENMTFSYLMTKQLSSETDMKQQLSPVSSSCHLKSKEPRLSSSQDQDQDPQKHTVQLTPTRD